MSRINTLQEADVAGKRVLVRVDFNVPLTEGTVGDDTRMQAALPTIKHLINRGAKVVLCSHLGRPEGCGYEETYSLAPVAQHLAKLLGMPVTFAQDTVGPDAERVVSSLQPGDVCLLENVRFDAREQQNNADFAAALANLADVYVNDAFGTAHRSHASTAGVAALLPSYAGLLLEKEVSALRSMLDNPRRPFVAILGGSKVSDKVQVIDALIDKCDTLIIGGGMCFTFLRAQGYATGTSLMEEDWIARAAEMLEKAKARNVQVLLPVDVVCADQFKNDARIVTCSVADIPADMMGLDIGPKTVELYAQAIETAHTVFWNGPMGVFELSSYEAGTKGVAYAVAQNVAADTIIGGGDSVAAVNKFNLADKMTFISTGGGASMELVQGANLPGVKALEKEA